MATTGVVDNGRSRLREHDWPGAMRQFLVGKRCPGHPDRHHSDVFHQGAVRLRIQICQVPYTFSNRDCANERRAAWPLQRGNRQSIQPLRCRIQTAAATAPARRSNAQSKGLRYCSPSSRPACRAPPVVRPPAATCPMRSTSSRSLHFLRRRPVPNSANDEACSSKTPSEIPYPDSTAYGTVSHTNPTMPPVGTATGDLSSANLTTLVNRVPGCGPVE